MRKNPGKIVVVAGTNGAGKSVIAGEMTAAHRLAYLNPDELAKVLMATGKSREEANAIAWRFGYEGLRNAVDRNENFALETTLGGESIAAELHRAARLNREVHILYVGLSSVDLHIQRVHARVARGGHDIPEQKIRERYVKSMVNLLGLVGKIASLQVFDNSEESSTGVPRAKLVLRMKGKRIVEPDRRTLLLNTPDWAKPIVAKALRERGAPA